MTTTVIHMSDIVEPTKAICGVANPKHLDDFDYTCKRCDAMLNKGRR